MYFESYDVNVRAKGVWRSALAASYPYFGQWRLAAKENIILLYEECGVRS